MPLLLLSTISSLILSDICHFCYSLTDYCCDGASCSSCSHINSTLLLKFRNKLRASCIPCHFFSLPSTTQHCCSSVLEAFAILARICIFSLSDSFNILSRSFFLALYPFISNHLVFRTNVSSKALMSLNHLESVPML